MKIGMVGLGKMGGNMATRIGDAGHEVVGYDPHSDASQVGSLAELVERLGRRRGWCGRWSPPATRPSRWSPSSAACCRRGTS